MMKKSLLVALAVVLLTSALAGCTRSLSDGDEASPKFVLVHATVENRMDSVVYAYPRFTFMDDFQSNAESFGSKDKWSCDSSWAQQHPDVVQWPSRWQMGSKSSLSDNCRTLYPEESPQITLELAWSRDSDTRTEEHTLKEIPLESDTHFQIHYIIHEDGDLSIELESRSWDSLRGGNGTASKR